MKTCDDFSPLLHCSSCHADWESWEMGEPWGQPQEIWKSDVDLGIRMLGPNDELLVMTCCSAHDAILEKLSGQSDGQR